MRERSLREEEHREDVRPESALELLRADVFDALLRMLLGGVVDEDVEFAELVRHLVDDFVAMLLVPDVAGDSNALALLGFDKPTRFLGILFLLEIRNRDVRT